MTVWYDDDISKFTGSFHSEPNTQILNNFGLQARSRSGFSFRKWQWVWSIEATR